MNQLVQNYKTGEITLEDLPVPAPKSGTILVRNIASVVSVGTEKLMTDLARRSLLRKALARPDLVKRVMDKARTDGVGEALRQAMRRLDAPVPLGYSCSGVVVQVGPDVREVCADQLVACGGHAAASHAEVVRVPRNLCVPVADGVEPEDAAFAFIGAIALHTVRMAQVRIGERVAIIGLGLLGQIAVQIVRAAGAEAFGLDLDESRVRLSLDLGASAGVAVGAGALERALQFTGGSGFDAVLVLASTTGSQPVRMAAELARDQGRIAASGMVRMDMPRDVLYEKELRVIVPRSAGAGIYDAAYEERGVDYPAAYVPWTQQRNMRAFLGLVAAGSVRLSPLITHRFPIGRALDAYRLLSGELREPYLGVVLTYDGDRPACTSQRVEVAHRSPPARGTPRVGVVGAGLFATGVLLPALRKVGGVHLAGVATTSGVSAQHVARKFGFEYSTTNADEVIQAPDTDAVMILTRHGSHSDLARRALAAGKAVFVEKPLATTEAQLRRIERACASGEPRLMVGFNRRFAPMLSDMKEAIGNADGDLVIVCRVNAGVIQQGHWVRDEEDGGGRIIGEVCHFVDLVQYLAGAHVMQVYARRTPREPDNVCVTLAMASGAVATIIYTASGNKAFPRERVEAFTGRTACAVDDFRRATFAAGGRRWGRRSFVADRGHRRELETFVECVRNGLAFPVAFRDYVNTTRATFAIEQSLREGRPVRVEP